MFMRSLRLWSGIGAGLLIAGVVVLAVGVALWKPLSSAPEAWAIGTGALIGSGLIVTIVATSVLAARGRRP